MSTVIVFGASGLLGSSLVPTLRYRGYSVLTQGRSGDVDICLNPSDRDAVFDVLKKYRPTSLINLVGATSVDQCELEPRVAWIANARVVANIATSISALSDRRRAMTHLVHISTDQVYDGPGPHSEEDVDLINVYGLSKFTGELFAERTSATVLRTNFFGRSRSPRRKSFSDWLVENLKDNTPITVFDDVIFSALHLDTVCDIIEKCIKSRPIGVFNAGCRDSLSKAEFAFELARALNLPTNQLRRGESASAQLKARRPRDMSLQVALLENSLGVQLPSIYSQIEYTAEEYKNEGLFPETK